MKKNIVIPFLWYFFRVLLWFRYRLVFKGQELLTKESLSRPGGVLFLPNHPAVFVDPVSVALGIWKTHPIRPMVVEYFFYAPIVHWIMKNLSALPVPNFSASSNSLKRKRSERVFEEVARGLRMGDNFLIYPAGGTKAQAKEILGGASGLHRVLAELPETNIVLVRIKGAWGSRFSRYFTGKAAHMFPIIRWGIKQVLKNGLFFTPRRKIIVEFLPVPPEFPRYGSRLEVNRWLENWYNLPDGMTEQEGEHPGDSLILRPYSIWSKKLPEKPIKEAEAETFDLEKISPEIKRKVVNKLAELTEIPAAKITADRSISTELGLDSLDTAELSAFLHDEYDISGVPVSEFTTVGKMMALASKQVVYQEVTEESQFSLSRWKELPPRKPLFLPEGKTVQEVFLQAAYLHPKKMVIADDRLGPMDYRTTLMRAIILAQHLQKLPGKNVGIVLPASTAAFIAIMATLLAGKVPVMINWTVGPRHLESVVELSQIKTTLSSWAFIDKLEGVEFNGIEETFVMLEDIRREVSLQDKIRGYLLARKAPQKILKSFGIEDRQGRDTAVILFTSGTENNPKGVPLSHENILSNLRPIFHELDIYTDDTILGILPPFHSFGFTISAMALPLAGARVAFYPKPTDGKKLAEQCEKWGATIVCGAPTFLKGMLKAATKENVKTARLFVTGAEKAPDELFQQIRELSSGMILEGYGITECSPVLTLNRPDRAKKGVGQAVPNVELKIVHPETFVPLGRNEQGMILARGPNIFAGYLNPGLESPFIEIAGENWYKTGDLGILDINGYLTISGRLKRFVKIGGEMISLSAVEDALLSEARKRGWPLIQEGPSIAVIAQETPSHKTKLTLFTAFSIDLEEINKAIKASGFSNLVRIGQVEFIKEIPIMGTGKIHYRALEQQYLLRSK